MTNIVERLRDHNTGDGALDRQRLEAADEIERLQKMQQGYREESSDLRIQNVNLKAEIERLQQEAKHLSRWSEDKVAELQAETERLPRLQKIVDAMEADPDYQVLEQSFERGLVRKKLYDELLQTVKELLNPTTNMARVMLREQLSEIIAKIEGRIE